ncbi:hypothetical protein FIBSPDRAFT_927730 [Athelia psychrophila]|uniref:Uncharacterized protein n=1 Tax=Athelia psychrophila TaxID=1759441 RepID=A0A166R8M2_9AGAM|nr:hypothetical protein FIBSPDRAFT_927730 [Fibularhizoctonia sp. CBS 109695]
MYGAWSWVYELHECEGNRNPSRLLCQTLHNQIINVRFLVAAEARKNSGCVCPSEWAEVEAGRSGFKIAARAPNLNASQEEYCPSDDPANEVDEATPKADKLKTKSLFKDRLYVRNLHPTVDKYTILIFSKYGTIKSMDYLFHTGARTCDCDGPPRSLSGMDR